MTRTDHYPLGYTSAEARRLEIQAAVLEQFTADTLDRTGLAPGMRVLDLGCGVGDVSLLAARRVGPSGSVIGVDRSSASLESARRRAADQGLGNVTFEAADLVNWTPQGTFDAVIGRFVLLYLADAASAVRRLCQSLRQGGGVAFLEVDMSAASQAPPSPLFGTVNSWVFGAFDAAGADRDMGSKLLATFLGAGLPRPAMLAMTPVESGPDSGYYEFLTQMVRSMTPVIERAGIAKASEIDLETLADRLRDDAVRHQRVLFPPRIVSAWVPISD